MRQLPPLKSLVSFEAAARHGSFTQAAKELNVTQSAISHQVKILEDNLHTSLFNRVNRENRKLTLTYSGRALLPEVTESLNKIEEVTTQLRRSRLSSSNMLSVRVAPSFALAWLSPRLGDFWHKFPDVELCLYHSHAPTAFDQENIDIAVTYGKGDWPGVDAKLLLKLDFFPVCSPRLLARIDTSGDMSHLNNFPLLHEIDYQCWADWVALAGLKHLNPYRGLIIDDTNVLVQAAIDGKGIALGSSIFVDKYLQDGSLIRLSDTVLENDDGYYVVSPNHHLSSRLVSSFTDWIMAQER